MQEEKNIPYKKYNVVIVQRILPHYRVKFFNILDRYLRQKNIHLTVIYGNEEKGMVPKTIHVSENWAYKVKCNYYKVFGKTMYSMNISKENLLCDLLILEHAASFINLYSLMFGFNKNKIALWGHGANLQSKRNSYIKTLILKKAAWWFGYTNFTKRILENKNYNKNKITIVNNTIDTSVFEIKENVYRRKKNNIKQDLNLEGDNICVYCGGIYSHKKIDFLLESANQLSEKIDNFYLLIIGHGPEQEKVIKACKQNNNIKYIGQLYGEDRVPYLKMAKAMLMPGMVGLTIVDSFAAATPIITTNIDIHSPEIEYLKNGVNGLMVEHKLTAYIDAVGDYLTDIEKQKVLEEGCLKSASKYSLDSMVTNFGNGIISCLRQNS